MEFKMFNAVKGWIMSHNPALRNYPKTLDLSPLVDTVIRAKDITSWTPDALTLESRAYQPVFILCQLSKGGTEHSWIERHFKLTDDEGRSMNPAALTKKKYELWIAKRGPDTYPIPLETKAPAVGWYESTGKLNRRRTARLKGRIYLVRADIIFQLDRLRHNGVLFHRQLIDVQVPYRFLGGHQLGEARLSHEFLHNVRAWFYVADNDYWDSVIDVGHYFTPAHLFQPRNPQFRKWAVEPYYYFNPKAYANTT